jgi:ribosomal protein S1
LGWDNLTSPGDLFDEKDEIPLKVISLDQQQRRIVLSLKDYLQDMDSESEMNLRAEIQRRAGMRKQAKETVADAS